MTTDKKVARLLELAKELNCVSQARKLIGYSRQQFYEISCNHQTYVTNGCLDRLLGCKGSLRLRPHQVNSFGFRGWAGAEITHSYSTLKKV